MLKLVVNPNIDLEVLEEMGFEKRYSEYTGELVYYIDETNRLIIYIEPKSLEIGNDLQYSYEREQQVIKLMRLFSEEILLLEEENINTENENIEGNE